MIDDDQVLHHKCGPMPDDPIEARSRWLYFECDCPACFMGHVNGIRKRIDTVSDSPFILDAQADAQAARCGAGRPPT
jgi:hypothetical protein